MDPGIITNEYYLENYDVDKINLNKYKICEICNVIIDLDKGVEHCSDCNILILLNTFIEPFNTQNSEHNQQRGNI